MFDIVWLRGRVSSSTEYKYKHDQRIPSRGESSVIQTPTLIKQKYKNTNLKTINTPPVTQWLFSFSYKMLLNLIIPAGRKVFYCGSVLLLRIRDLQSVLMPSTNRVLVTCVYLDQPLVRNRNMNGK